MPNHLVNESSPYLLQHKDNPVDWYPWCQTALQRADNEDKPIFLSIGYSACHWCHVMERESFEDEQIAELLNDNFICIKVDREERPEIDQIYMDAVMALRQGQGGWPLSVFLTPQQHVFFGGTYWPPRSRVGMPGFDHVLHSVLDAFANRRDQVEDQSLKISDWLNEVELADTNFQPNHEILSSAASVLCTRFDTENGGFGDAPKFPHTMDLMLLLRLLRDAKSSGATESQNLETILTTSMKKMAYGGIFDHLAGGFARYTVDEAWLIPHFEKMLYDNALLAQLYSEMFCLTGDRFYEMVCRKTLDYLLREMRNQHGAFFSSEDADSEGIEGKFYVWEFDEIRSELSKLDHQVAARFCDLYNVTQHGNFEGSNILNMTESYQQFADRHGIGKEQLREEMRSCRKHLLNVREQRVRPNRDDKILVNWNALSISALAAAGRHLQEPKFIEAAKTTAEHIWEQLRREDGRLLHSTFDGQSNVDGFLDDYSFTISAFLEIYYSSLDEIWISRAAQLADLMTQFFWDEQNSGFFFTASDHEKLISRPKIFQDSSIPSGNAMAAGGLIQLGRLVGNQNWIEMGEETIRSASNLLQRSPLASGQMLIATHELLTNSDLIVFLASDTDRLDTFKKRAMREGLGIAMIVSKPNEQSNGSPFGVHLEGKTCVDGEPTLYECKQFTCREPVVGETKIDDWWNRKSVSFSD